MTVLEIALDAMMLQLCVMAQVFPWELMVVICVLFVGPGMDVLMEGRY